MPYTGIPHIEDCEEVSLYRNVRSTSLQKIDNSTENKKVLSQVNDFPDLENNVTDNAPYNVLTCFDYFENLLKEEMLLSHSTRANENMNQLRFYLDDGYSSWFTNKKNRENHNLKYNIYVKKYLVNNTKIQLTIRFSKKTNDQDPHVSIGCSVCSKNKEDIKIKKISEMLEKSMFNFYKFLMSKKRDDDCGNFYNIKYISEGINELSVCADMLVTQ